MKRIKQSFYLLCGAAIIFSCTSNSLKQDQAEKTIREFLSDNIIQTSKGTISPPTIHKIEKTNIYSQFNTSVEVHFITKEGEEGVTLLFIFSRTPDNKWFLKSIESEDGTTPELSGWLTARKNLNIPVQ